jgi:hypothetical protein
MRKSISATTTVTATAAATLALLTLTGCSGDVERSLGLTRDAPDEFTVETRAPLSMPPNLDLQPPQPGARRPQEMTAQQAAEAALAPGAALGAPPPGPDTNGQEALIAAAGGPAPADVRQKLAAEQHLDQPRQGLTASLMFWKSPPQPGEPLDPAAESRRLREDTALGQPATVGDTPIIQEKKSSGGFLGIF